jgi:RNA polymerase sigma-70 factor (ECF subfamily)
VLGWAASEAAELLHTTVPAVNSALQRARDTLAKQSATSTDVVPANAPEVEAELLRRYMRAWEEADMRALAALLKEDAILTMPPAPSWYFGRDAIVAFFSTSPYVFGDETRRVQLVPTRANRQPAFAAYSWDAETNVFRAYGIMVLRLERGLLTEITGARRTS